MTDIFGPSSPASFAYLESDPNGLDGCYWKTSQGTFLSGLETFSETWPDSGSMRNGCVYERQILGLLTCESASSFWPTARREDGESCGNHPGATDSLTGATKQWNNTHDKTPNLSRQVYRLHQDQMIADGPTSSAKDPTSRRRLNPRFVEWLMGFPIMWTEL
jgi:hypothetical protein